jgi:hypothetical protein
MKDESDHGTFPVHTRAPSLAAGVRPLSKVGRKVTGSGIVVGRTAASIQMLHTSNPTRLIPASSAVRIARAEWCQG